MKTFSNSSDLFKTFLLRWKWSFLASLPCNEARLSCNICGWWESLNRKPRQKFFQISLKEGREGWHVLKDFAGAHSCLTSAESFGSKNSQADASLSNSIWKKTAAWTQEHKNLERCDYSPPWQLVHDSFLLDQCPHLDNFSSDFFSPNFAKLYNLLLSSRFWNVGL